MKREFSTTCGHMLVRWSLDNEVLNLFKLFIWISFWQYFLEENFDLACPVKTPGLVPTFSHCFDMSLFWTTFSTLYVSLKGYPSLASLCHYHKFPCFYDCCS